MTSGPFPRPVLLTVEHDCSGFDCGNDTLNKWLTDRALRNQSAGASRTFVTAIDGRVIGYYCLSNYSIVRGAATKRVARNMPDPVPAVLLGKLAVTNEYKNQRIGKGLLRDAIARVLTVANDIGIRAIVVHPADQDAWHFYSHFGFEPSLTDPMEMMILIQDLRETLGI